MTILKRFQGLIIGVIVIVVAFVAYSYFIAPSQEAPLSAENVAVTSSVDQDLISLLLELKSIRLDDRIFSDAAFRSLEDFSRELVPEPVGRNNPFAPLGARQATPEAR